MVCRLAAVSRRTPNCFCFSCGDEYSGGVGSRSRVGRVVVESGRGTVVSPPCFGQRREPLRYRHNVVGERFDLDRTLSSAFVVVSIAIVRAWSLYVHRLGRLSSHRQGVERLSKSIHHLVADAVLHRRVVVVGVRIFYIKRHLAKAITSGIYNMRNSMVQLWVHTYK